MYCRLVSTAQSLRSMLILSYVLIKCAQRARATFGEMGLTFNVGEKFYSHGRIGIDLIFWRIHRQSKWLWSTF